MNNHINFKLSEVKNLSQTDAKTYVTKYFVPLSNGGHAHFINGKYELIDDKIVKSTYFNRMSKELNTYYFKELTDIKTVVYKLDKPVFYDDNINLCPKMKHAYKPYVTFSDAIKKNINKFLGFIKEVICSDNNDSYDFILKWTANMIKGKKNNSCIYLKGSQGIGKSTLPQFIKKYVIGDDLSLETGSAPLKSNFNSVLAGKLFVVFEELENMNASEWNSMSSVLKRIITSDRILLEAKNQNSYEADNLNNYMLLSNNDSIKDDCGRRYFIADVTAKREGDIEYWTDLNTSCFNDLVGEAFYCYLMEVDTNKFNPQSFPMTNNKIDSINKRLDSVQQFLKDCYILLNLGINCSVQDLYDAYVVFCASNTKKPYNKIDFNKHLSTLNINHYKSNGQNKYKITCADLLAIANKKHWIHKLDEFKFDPDVDEELDYKTLYENAQKEIEQLKANKQTEVVIIKKKNKKSKDIQVDTDDDKSFDWADVQKPESKPKTADELLEEEFELSIKK